MSILEFLKPSSTPRNVSAQGEMVILRERIFHSFMLFASIMAIVGSLVVIPLSISRGKLSSLIIMTVVLGLFLFLTLGRNVPYLIRAIILLTALFAVGVYTFSFSGLAGNGKIIFLALPIISGILIGLQAGIISLVLSTLTFIGFGYLMTNGVIPVPAPDLYGNSAIPNDWISGIVYFVLLSVMATISLTAFINNLQSNISRQKDLALEVDKERQTLEATVNQRTTDLANRLYQIRSAAEISRSISSVLNLNELLQDVVELIRERFDLYYVGVFLIDESGKYAILKAGTGEAGRVMIARQHQLLVAGASMVGWATANQKPRIALDVGDEAVRFNNPLLPKTRSELALPIVSKAVSLGALTIQSERPNAFDNDDIMILQGVADSLAVAIENANLFTMTQKNLEEIGALNRQYLQQAWDETLGQKGEMGFTYSATASQSGKNQTGMVTFPISLRDQIIGEITLEMDSEQVSTQDQAVIDTITTQTAQALENARLLEDVGRKALQEERLNAMSSEFSQANSVEEIIRTALLNLSQIPNVSEVSMHLIPLKEINNHAFSPDLNNGNGHHSREN